MNLRSTNVRTTPDTLYAFFVCLFVCLFREWYVIRRDKAFSVVAKQPRTRPEEKKL